VETGCFIRPISSQDEPHYPGGADSETDSGTDVLEVPDRSGRTADPRLLPPETSLRWGKMDGSGRGRTDGWDGRFIRVFRVRPLAAHQLLPRSIPVFLDLATCFAGRLFSHVSVLVSPPCSDGNSDGNAGVLDGYNARWRTNSWMIACEEMASRCGK